MGFSVPAGQGRGLSNPRVLPPGRGSFQTPREVRLPKNRISLTARHSTTTPRSVKHPNTSSRRVTSGAILPTQMLSRRPGSNPVGIDDNLGGADPGCAARPRAVVWNCVAVRGAEAQRVALLPRRKMKLAKDKRLLRVHDSLTLGGIPPAGFDYQPGQPGTNETDLASRQPRRTARRGDVGHTSPDYS